MQAIIFADRMGNELKPLCDDTCPALLPIANRPMLEYTLDDLAETGITEVLIVACKNIQELKDYFGNGTLWGMKVTYLLSRGEEDPNALLQRYKSRLNFPLLAMRGDVLRTSGCKSFLKQTQAYKQALIQTEYNDPKTDIYFLRGPIALLQDLDWEREYECIDIKSEYHSYDIHCNAIRDIRSYFEVSLGIVKERMRSGMTRHITNDLIAGPQTNIGPENHIAGEVLVGQQSNISKHARMSGPAIICDHCYIDRDAVIENSIVLPGTYVGQGLEVKNAIVSGDYLIRIDSNSYVQISDPLLLTKMQQDLTGAKVPLSEKVSALLLTVLSFPLWLLAATSHLPHTKNKFLIKKKWLGNRFITTAHGMQRELITVSLLNTNIPVLRHLPLLWSVIKGELRLFGSTSLQQGTSLDKDSQKDKLVAGLLGPAQLILPANAPVEEVLLNEITFQQENGFTTLGKRLYQARRALFQSRAWTSPQQDHQDVEHVY